jgi:hypothetical protein
MVLYLIVNIVLDDILNLIEVVTLVLILLLAESFVLLVMPSLVLLFVSLATKHVPASVLVKRARVRRAVRGGRPVLVAALGAAFARPQLVEVFPYPQRKFRARGELAATRLVNYRARIGLLSAYGDVAERLGLGDRTPPSRRPAGPGGQTTLDIAVE